MSAQIEGFEDVADQIDQLGDAAESADGRSSVSFTELFPRDFMRTYSEFESIGAFFEESPWTVVTDEDFEQIPEDEFDRYVTKHTGFDSWETMLSVAGREWLSKQIST